MANQRQAPPGRMFQDVCVLGGGSVMHGNLPVLLQMEPQGLWSHLSGPQFLHL